MTIISWALLLLLLALNDYSYDISKNVLITNASNHPYPCLATTIGKSTITINYYF